MRPNTFSSGERPVGLKTYKKKTTVQLSFRKEPFYVDTQEGWMLISPSSVDDWEGGYYIAYPDDGSKPYAIAPSFVRENYEEVEE